MLQGDGMNGGSTDAGIVMPAVFADGMVLQRRERCPVWGRTAPGAPVRVAFRGRTFATRADDAGAWRVNVEAGEAGGPFTLTVDGEDRIEIRGVGVGEVWLVSGQSNAGQVTKTPYAAPADDPEGVRFFTMGPGAGSGGRWVTEGALAMLAWHFGRDLRRRLGVPVGIIVSAVGGTCIEQWKPGPDAGISRAGPAGDVVGEAGGLYAERIVPLQPYRLKGVAWWQGESNADNAPEYLDKFVALIDIWRRAWGQDALPFMWVQLQRIVRSGPDWWLRIADARAAIADAQFRALSLVPRSAMVAAYDVTEGDLHPPDGEKRLIAERLATAAESLAYGGTAEGSGPLPAEVVREGDRLRVRFTHAEGGLETRKNLTAGGGDLRGVELRSGDGDFQPVAGRIEGASVVVFVAGLEPPFAVRYAWGPQPAANLYNRSGLPAPTFRLP